MAQKQKRSQKRPSREPRREDLLEEAKRRGIPGRSRMSKTQLLEALGLSPTVDKKPKLAESPSPTAAAPRRHDELPWDYGVTHLVLMPVDPFLAHAYWEITPETLNAVQRQLGSSAAAARSILRVYDVTAIHFDGANAHRFFDLSVDLSARNWYVSLWSAEKSLIAELGMQTPEGRFHPIARSNVIHTPRAGVSIFEEAPWAEPGTSGLRLHAGEPRYGPLPIRRGRPTFWKKLEKSSLELTRGMAAGYFSPAAHPTITQRRSS